MAYRPVQREMEHGLPRLETTSINSNEFDNSIRTAPPLAASIWSFT